MPMSVADRLPAALRLPPGMRASIAALQDAAAPAPAVLPAVALAHARTLGTRRSLEFLGARALAAPLLDAAGFPGFALLPDADGSPAWPDGAWGSLSHSRGLAFVACGCRPADALGFGIDLATDDDALAVLKQRHQMLADQQRVLDQQHAQRA